MRMEKQARRGGALMPFSSGLLLHRDGWGSMYRVLADILPDSSFPVLRRAMGLSLLAGLGLMIWKVWGAHVTGSVVVYSDAMESVVHFLTVVFASWSLYFSRKPADESHHFGHDKVAYLSAGFEGAMITLAAGLIVFQAAGKFQEGTGVTRVDLGLLVTFVALMVNVVVGTILIHYGRRHRELIVESNGKHLMTDVTTSAGSLGGLLLVRITGHGFWDPLAALVCGGAIAWTGWRLLNTSLHGLLDRTDDAALERARASLAASCSARRVGFHNLRLRHTGASYWIEVHLVFDDGVPVVDAHHRATEIERDLALALGPSPVQIISHLEPQSHELVDEVWETAPGLPSRDERGG